MNVNQCTFAVVAVAACLMSTDILIEVGEGRVYAWQNKLHYHMHHLNLLFCIYLNISSFLSRDN